MSDDKDSYGTKEIDGRVKRGADGIKCSCGGFCERAETTADERSKYGCGKPWSCCDAAFVCVLCKTRWVGREEAPEMG